MIREFTELIFKNDKAWDEYQEHLYKEDLYRRNHPLEEILFGNDYRYIGAKAVREYLWQKEAIKRWAKQ